MTKQTHASVTESRCECGHMDQLAKIPSSPVTFNPDVQEYHIEYRTPSGAHAAISVYHCIFCGGRLKDSTRHLLFENIPDVEQARLDQLVSNLKTADDTLRALGRPDVEHQIASESLPLQDTNDESRPTRSLTYNRLSTVADIHVNVAPNGSVAVLVVPKSKTQ
jgi:hypothetical protein